MFSVRLISCNKILIYSLIFYDCYIFTRGTDKCACVSMCTSILIKRHHSHGCSRVNSCHVSPKTAFRCFTAGSATKCFRHHWRFVLTTPIWCCPAGDNGVSTVRERMAPSLSVSQEPDKKENDLSDARAAAFYNLESFPVLFLPHHAIPSL